MKCMRCGGAQKTARESYRYTESGLTSVVLMGVDVSRCANCDEQEVAIPNIEELHRAIAKALIMKPERLAPEEIRYLRKHLGFSQPDLAAHLGVKVETISRWENKKAEMEVPTEKLLRFLVARKDPVEQYAYENELKRVATKRPRSAQLNLSRKAQGWRQQPAA